MSDVAAIRVRPPDVAAGRPLERLVGNGARDRDRGDAVPAPARDLLLPAVQDRAGLAAGRHRRPEDR